ncbi:hypothetical protein [Chryseobacterium sp. KCF3-3]|uniref:hypothetical protein n=1 Tax=Chryseobacterium sp. KCF3-3 TaxID=3231511 RepID=UPI0038B2D955
MIMYPFLNGFKFWLKPLKILFLLNGLKSVAIEYDLSQILLIEQTIHSPSLSTLFVIPQASSFPKVG